MKKYKSFLVLSIVVVLVISFITIFITYTQGEMKQNAKKYQYILDEYNPNFEDQSIIFNPFKDKDITILSEQLTEKFGNKYLGKNAYINKVFKSNSVIAVETFVFSEEFVKLSKGRYPNIEVATAKFTEVLASEDSGYAIGQTFDFTLEDIKENKTIVISFFVTGIYNNNNPYLNSFSEIMMPDITKLLSVDLLTDRNEATIYTFSDIETKKVAETFLNENGIILEKLPLTTQYEIFLDQVEMYNKINLIIIILFVIGIFGAGAMLLHKLFYSKKLETGKALLLLFSPLVGVIIALLITASSAFVSIFYLGGKETFITSTSVIFVTILTVLFEIFFAVKIMLNLKKKEISETHDTN